LSFICVTIHIATLALYPSALNEQFLIADIREIATYKTNGWNGHPFHRWALTSPSHPYHKRICDGYFLLRYYTFTGIFPLGSVMLCVVRTFLCSGKRTVTKQPTEPQR